MTTGVGDDEAVSAVLDRIYRAVESSDQPTVRNCLTPDAFVLGPEADSVFDSADAVVANLAGRLQSLRDSDLTVRIRTTHRLVGSTEASGGWVFDQIVVETSAAGGVHRELAVRVTALVVHGQNGPRLAAAYWSVPYETQDEQDAVKHAGHLRPGDELADAVEDTARPLVDQLVTALGEPGRLPQLYSSRAEHVTIGSVVDEVFEGAAGRAAWQQFVQFVTAFEPRGLFRARLVAPDLGWVAANIDIGDPPTPYRFFYVWQREDEGWRIVVSHDGVSRNACAAD